MLPALDRCLIFLSLSVAALAQTPNATGILAQKCFDCHGDGSPMAGLDLRTRASALKGGDHGPALVPGDTAASHLYRRIAGQEQPQMPMGGQLSTAEIETIKNWIVAGAQWDAAPVTPPTAGKFTDQQRNFWAFQKVVKAPVPSVKQAAWVRTPIDAFVLAKLEDRGLKPNPPADKVTLIRRAYFDLIGLPPSPEEVQAFVADHSPTAFETVVDRLLASPRYGERWGRFWLDLARYADSNGFKADEVRPNAWRYRDYVIQSFNDDKPYDRFMKEQIAGDELYPGDAAAKIATGLNRLWPDESNMANPILRRQEILNDITDTVGAAFMGMTYGCAKCHDHKFDPILQKDYYRLQAFFANTRNDDHSSLLSGPDAAAYQQQYDEWKAKTGEIRTKIEAILAPVRESMTREGIGMFPKEAQEAIFTPPEKRNAWQWQIFYRSESRLPSDTAIIRSLKGDVKLEYAELAKELDQFAALKPQAPPMAEVQIENSRNAPPTYVLSKGLWDSPLDEVQPGFLTILDPNTPKIVPPDGLESSGRRSALANWLADPKNPLTTRVIANRIWQGHFGTGIVASSSDFGVMGDRPANPELLDYLTATFVENGWSIKKLHRTIMLSSAYQQSSASRDDAAAADPDNKLIWHFARRRLEGEVIRDSMLSASGLLNLKAGGPGIFPPLPPGTVTKRSSYLNWPTEKNAAEADRRSVYIFVKRNLRYPMFESFDFPDTHESCPRRYASVSPTQPLALMNDDLVLEWSRVLAGRVLNDGGQSPAQEVDRAFRLVFSRAPADDERQAVLDFLSQQTGLLAARLAANDKPPIPDNVPAGMEPARAAAFVEFCHALMNSNEFIYMN